MSQRKHVQPLRSRFILPSREVAITALKELCNAIDDNTPKDGELVSARYFVTNDEGVSETKSVIGLFNQNIDETLSVTIFDNEDSVNDKDLYWENLS